MCSGKFGLVTVNFNSITDSSLQANCKPFTTGLSNRKHIQLQQPLHCRKHVFDVKFIFLSAIFSYATVDIEEEDTDLWTSSTLQRSP